MRLSIITLIIVLGLILATQVITLFAQYRINRTYKGIGYWLIGSSLMALGFLLMPLVAVESLKYIALISNPLLILGHIFGYMGIKKFISNKKDKWLPISIFLVFNLFYLYYMFININMNARTVVISAAIAIISFLIVLEFFLEKDNFLSEITNFTPIIFFVYGSINIIRILYTINSTPTNSYIDIGYSIIIAVVVVAILFSNLWTFSLIIMVNQRLNMENQLKKEKLELIFNTNIDAQLITRLKDGLIVDVNDEFSRLSGYSKIEVIGNFTKDIIFWHNLEDRQIFIKELNDKGTCRNMEFEFQRKDGDQFVGMISARVITIHSVIHIISVVRDITQRKSIELKMEKLVKQLEIEKSTAQLNAITDSLTGLYNRGYFDNTLRTEFFRLMRSRSTLSLIMLDIDHFKKFNDSYGHLAGDKCIQMISTMLKNTVERASDIAARYGGEEFIIILPETDERGAKTLGEKIRKSVEGFAIPHIGSETAKYVTVSVGIVTVYPSKLKSPDEVLKMVDDVLYCAKEQGRNCSVFTSDGKSYESIEAVGFEVIESKKA